MIRRGLLKTSAFFRSLLDPHSMNHQSEQRDLSSFLYDIPVRIHRLQRIIKQNDQMKVKRKRKPRKMYVVLLVYVY